VSSACAQVSVQSQPATIESDTFDKTLALDGNKIIWSFQWADVVLRARTIAEVITEIVRPPLSRFTQFAQVVEEIFVEVRRRLNSEHEVIFHCRRLDSPCCWGDPNEIWTVHRFKPSSFVKRCYQSGFPNPGLVHLPEHLVRGSFRARFTPSSRT
jgi:hypothetical protein